MPLPQNVGRFMVDGTRMSIPFFYKDEDVLVPITPPEEFEPESLRPLISWHNSSGQGKGGFQAFNTRAGTGVRLIDQPRVIYLSNPDEDPGAEYRVDLQTSIPAIEVRAYNYLKPRGVSLQKVREKFNHSDPHSYEKDIADAIESVKAEDRSSAFYTDDYSGLMVARDMLDSAVTQLFGGRVEMPSEKDIEHAPFCPKSFPFPMHTTNLTYKFCNTPSVSAPVAAREALISAVVVTAIISAILRRNPHLAQMGDYFVRYVNWVDSITNISVDDEARYAIQCIANCHKSPYIYTKFLDV